MQDVIVYGSKARGDCNEDSDIDVLVIVADGAAERHNALSGIRRWSCPCLPTVRGGLR